MGGDTLLTAKHLHKKTKTKNKKIKKQGFFSDKQKEHCASSYRQRKTHTKCNSRQEPTALCCLNVPHTMHKYNKAMCGFDKTVECEHLPPSRIYTQFHILCNTSLEKKTIQFMYKFQVCLKILYLSIKSLHHEKSQTAKMLLVGWLFSVSATR